LRLARRRTKLLDADELAAMLRIHRREVWAHFETGRISGRKIPGVGLRFDFPEVRHDLFVRPLNGCRFFWCHLLWWNWYHADDQPTSRDPRRILAAFDALPLHLRCALLSNQRSQSLKDGAAEGVFLNRAVWRISKAIQGCEEHLSENQRRRFHPLSAERFPSISAPSNGVPAGSAKKRAELWLGWFEDPAIAHLSFPLRIRHVIDRWDLLSDSDRRSIGGHRASDRLRTPQRGWRLASRTVRRDVLRAAWDRQVKGKRSAYGRDLWFLLQAAEPNKLKRGTMRDAWNNLTPKTRMRWCPGRPATIPKGSRGYAIVTAAMKSIAKDAQAVEFVGWFASTFMRLREPGPIKYHPARLRELSRSGLTLDQIIDQEGLLIGCRFSNARTSVRKKIKEAIRQAEGGTKPGKRSKEQPSAPPPSKLQPEDENTPAPVPANGDGAQVTAHAQDPPPRPPAASRQLTFLGANGQNPRARKRYRRRGPYRTGFDRQAEKGLFEEWQAAKRLGIATIEQFAARRGEDADCVREALERVRNRRRRLKKREPPDDSGHSRGPF